MGANNVRVAITGGPSDDEILDSIINNTELKLSIQRGIRPTSLKCIVVDYGKIFNDGDYPISIRCKVDFTVQLYFPDKFHKGKNDMEIRIYYSPKTKQGVFLTD